MLRMGWDGHRMLLSVTLGFGPITTHTKTISSPSFCFPSPHSIVTCCDHDAHPPSDVTFPCGVRELPPLHWHLARARAHRLARCSSALGPSLLPMSGSQPSPNRTTSRLPAMEGTALLNPRSWPPSGTHPPPGGRSSTANAAGYLVRASSYPRHRFSSGFYPFFALSVFAFTCAFW